jgi:phage terminase Nu1 subunit (DNA packaging protein)
MRGFSFAYSIEIGQQLNIAEGFLAESSTQIADGKSVDESDEIIYKAKLTNECATYIGKTIKADKQGFSES